jgi:hypothetical protein
LFPPNARFFELALKVARRCTVKILVYYIPMRKVEFAAAVAIRCGEARPTLPAGIVGPRVGSGKLVSHAWREQFVADN